jgi:hypothetical protein
VECLASACEQITKHVPPVGGGTRAVATEDIISLLASCCPVAFDDSLWEVFLQIVIGSSKPIRLEIAKKKRITGYLGTSTFLNEGWHVFF